MVISVARRPVTIGGRLLGAATPCLVIAEAGINHNGDVGLAHQLIDAAAAAGADMVKFQNYRTESFLSGDNLTITYDHSGDAITESQFELFKRCELSREALRALRVHAARAGLLFSSTPTDEEGLQDLVDLKVDAIKNGSDFLGHLPLVRAMAQSGIPVIMSTGMATLAEIAESVGEYRAHGGEDLVLLHCVSTYPAPMEDLNLRAVASLAQTFGVPTGFSDHSIGTTAAIAAVSIGASVIEKHFTLDRNLAGPDHWFSSDPAELARLITDIRAAEAALGNGTVGVSPTERQSREEFRLSCVAGRDMRAGERLRQTDVVFRRPGTGLAPRHALHLIGRQLARDVPMGHIFAPSRDFV